MKEAESVVVYLPYVEMIGEIFRVLEFPSLPRQWGGSGQRKPDP
jgi:hypothetical protein